MTDMPPIKRVGRRLHSEFHGGALAAADGIPREHNPHGNRSEGSNELARAWDKGWQATEELIAQGYDSTDAVCIAMDGKARKQK